MPLYNFRCSKCWKLTKKIMLASEFEDSPGWITCECGYTAPREMSPPSTKTMEVLDNGRMAKPVERLADAERIFAERATSHQRQYGSNDQDD